MRSGIEGTSSEDGDRNEEGRPQGTLGEYSALRPHAAHVAPDLVYRSQRALPSSPALRLRTTVARDAASQCGSERCGTRGRGYAGWRGASEGAGVV